MKKNIHFTIIAIIVTIVLFIILFSQIELKDIIEILKKINPLYLIAGFIPYIASYLLRAMRLHILLNKEVGVKKLFSIVCIHNAALNIFPVRSGELSYIYLLNKRHKIAIGEGVASLILIRIQDFIMISFLFFLFTFTSYDLPTNLMNTIKIISLILVFTILVFLIFLRNCERFINWLKIISIILNINERHLINYLFRKMDEMSGSLKKITFNQVIWSTILSIFSYIMVYLSILMIINAMGISMALELFLLSSTFFMMTMIIPIQGIGGFGTMEGGWAISFMIFGLAKEIAISSGIIMHIISIIYIILLFIIGFIGLREKPLTIDNV